MQQRTNECMKTLGFIMAVVCDHLSDKSTPNPQHDVPLAFCFTTDTEFNSLIVTPEMLQLIYRGYFAIAIVRFNPSMPDQFHVFTPRALPECVRIALLKKSEGLVNDAFSVSAREYN
jgi:hypothetical protein